MSQDSGGEPPPLGRRAAGRAAGPRPEPEPSSATTSPETPVPGDLFPAGQPPGTHVPDAPLPDPLFPGALPVLPRLRLSACRRPAAERDTEGDWLDVLVRPDGATALVIGHVEGSGGQPGAVAARLRAGLRDALRGGAAPAEVLAAPHAAAAGRAGPAPGRGAAVCVAVLDPLTGNLRYATAGLPVPVICAAAGDPGGHAPLARPAPAREVPARPVPAGPVLAGRVPGGQVSAGHASAGRVSGAAPVYAGNAVLPSGAVLLLYSGPAARTVADRAASVLADRRSAAAAGLADRMAPAVLAALTADGGGQPATVLAAHRLPAPVAGWSMNLPSDPMALRELRLRLRDWLRDLGVSESDRTDVELAVWEAAVNAIVHGQPVAGPATVTVRAGLDAAGRAVIQVSDRGRWRPPRPPDPGRRWPGGQGLLVIRQAADELDIAPGPDGTTVTVRRRLSRPVPGEAQPGEYPGTAERPGRPA
jgi:anti-sigma regulatory factor (Ser/Thr protein kinase)